MYFDLTSHFDNGGDDAIQKSVRIGAAVSIAGNHDMSHTRLRVPFSWVVKSHDLNEKSNKSLILVPDATTRIQRDGHSLHCSR
jgi:hypothetical protein